ncbi:MAG: FAD-dependent thymidylate synthase [Candidatus Desulfofervidaceae bacterium]|nr:FAD-dependent thymidylate synthase [Candidatus Desulfofervidaceae bacterium]MDL1969894.1 FAD-dependent thymidylate synthase [Candidatus Desulfofervidaceae bacterium]
MPETQLKVKLLAMTPHALAVIYAACRQCYSAERAEEIFVRAIQGIPPVHEQEAFVRKIVASGHESVIEHVSFTFAISGISRACSHQLVRHRIASYSQQSQRYVKAENFHYIIPPTIANQPELKRIYEETMAELQQKYNAIVAKLEEAGVKGEKARQDARFILPNACETRIVVTMNCRSLLNFFALRCCERAQWEIRALANEMLRLCKEKLPAVFAEAGPKCKKLGYCPEGKRSCGRMPLKERVIPLQKGKDKPVGSV